MPLREARASTSTPICCGENVYMRWGFREILEKRAADIIMPDFQKCGGLLEARKIADMAHTYYVPVAPHAVPSPITAESFSSPPQVAEQVVQYSEITRDLFGYQRLREKKYTAGQIDTAWSAPIEADFTAWLRENIDKLPVARQQIEEILKRRER